MITVRKSTDRGHFDFGWLDTRHTFSFGRYIDRQWMGFSSLRVINDDLIAPGQGFGTHPHDNMEIISYIVSGQLAHRDSLGHVRTISPGQVQAMSAGSGLEHSEFNPDTTTKTRLIQVWIKPRELNTPPRYDQREFPIFTHANTLHLLVSPDGSQGSLPIGQDARVFAGVYRAPEKIQIPTATSRHTWIQVLGGRIKVGQHTLADGDAAAISDEQPEVSSLGSPQEPAHILLFDLP